ncbi:MAG: hypothetical protein DRJ40_08485 [Thermoprotei archaeon]|nr:MAG: hypothetical protein DRJ40_08485 [Thermoprotei archaeon]
MSSNSYSGKFIEKLISDLEKLEQIENYWYISKGKKGNAVFVFRGKPVIIAVNLPYDIVNEFHYFAIARVIKRDSKFTLAHVIAYDIRYEGSSMTETVYRDDLVEVTAHYWVTKARVKIYDVDKREFEGIIKKEPEPVMPYKVNVSDRGIAVLKDMLYRRVKELKIGNVAFRIRECTFDFEKAIVRFDVVLPDGRIFSDSTRFEVDYSKLLTDDIKALAEDLIRLYNEYEELFKLELKKESEAFDYIYEWKIRCRGCHAEFTFAGKTFCEAVPSKCPRCGAEKVKETRVDVIWHDGYRSREESFSVETYEVSWYAVITSRIKEKVVVNRESATALEDIRARRLAVLEYMKRVCERARVKLEEHDVGSDSETFVLTDFTGRSTVYFCQGACFLEGSLLFGYIASVLKEKFNDFIYLLVENVLR